MATDQWGRVPLAGRCRASAGPHNRSSTAVVAIDPGAARSERGPAGIDRIIARAEHVFLPSGTGELHMEIHATDAPDAPAIIFVPSIGARARLQYVALGLFRDAGIHAIGLDRPGHGLSSGRRGDAPAMLSIQAIEVTCDYARERFGGKVGLVGRSLGGTIAWYALTREQPIAEVQLSFHELGLRNGTSGHELRLGRVELRGDGISPGCCGWSGGVRGDGERRHAHPQGWDP